MDAFLIIIAVGFALYLILGTIAIIIDVRTGMSRDYLAEREIYRANLATESK